MSRNRWMLVIACLAGGLAALRFGFSLEWDLLNYHLYNPHALLNGRLAIDVAAAQQQTFLNPALYVPLYLMFKYLGAGVMVFVVGALQAAQVLLLMLILEELTDRRVTEPWMLMVVAVLGVGGPVFLNQLGGTQGDTLLSALVLGGLLHVIRAVNRPGDSNVLRVGFTSGVLLGLACALKLTMALYAVAMTIAAFCWFGGKDRWRVITGLALGGVCGVMFAGGAWFYHQWQMYGNPIFPYFNDIFGSPWIDNSSYRDSRFLPATTWEWLFYPVAWLLDPLQVWEHRFRDIRVPVAIALVILLPLVRWRRLREDFPALGLTCLFLALSYLLWLWMFSIYRYSSVLELLAPAVLFSSCLLWARSRKSIISALVVLAATQALVDYHRPASTWEFQAGSATALAGLPGDAMVIIDDFEPNAYAALWLDDAIPLVRIRANFMRQTEPGPLMQEKAQNRVREHAGPVFLLGGGFGQSTPWREADLAFVGLAAPEPEDCEEFFQSRELQRLLRLKLCRLQVLER